MSTRISAVFHDHAQAEQAVTALRQLGINDSQISYVGPHSGTVTDTTSPAVASHEDADDTGERVGKGLAVGAGVGALFGLAAVAIPGIGPFITAGWLASALGVTGGAAAAGAIVGGTSGALSGALIKSGYTEDEANYYGSAVERGGIFVSVETSGFTNNAEDIRRTLSQYGGESIHTTA